MKYVVTGSAGHISQPLTEKLLSAGNEVVVIGRDAAKLQSLTDKGAVAAIGSLEDGPFLESTFAGADAAYLMIPPNFGAENFRQYQNNVASNFIAALKSNHIKYAVVLSSIGAHAGEGTGPVDGLADFEKMLSELPGINVKILRPSYFMTNLFNMIPLIKNMQIMGANFGDSKLVLVHTNDIAAAAAEELLALNFIGQSVRYIASDEKTGAEIASIIGNAVNKPDLQWVMFSDEQSREGLQQAGLPAFFAGAYTTMGQALREGNMQEDYWKNHPELSPTKLTDFAHEFAAAFN
ncbi:MAG: NAD(P)H-binding protein [Ferruginibacter sp.]